MAGLNQTEAKKALAACGAETATLQDQEVFVGPDAARGVAIEEELARVQQVVTELGHGKVFSLDTDARMAARAERLRGLVWPER